MNFCNIKFNDESYRFCIKTADNFLVLSSAENSISLKPSRGSGDVTSEREGEREA
jgi:hypothetical protein